MLVKDSMPRRKRTPRPGNTTTLFVKNMVCDRCIRVVTEELRNLGLDIRSVLLGEVVVTGESRDLPLDRIQHALRNNGFELIEDRRARIIEEIKRTVIRLIREGSERNRKYSVQLSEGLGLDYHYLSSLFSSVENVTIEHFVILQRIERAKELLKYGELTLSEIAVELGYRSVQHLSNQFKSVTGLTPTQFKRIAVNTRTPLDRVS
jgi:AraC-like DNA-binding protein